MLVKTLFPHSNNFGAAFTKAEGDEYDLPDDVAATLVEVGLVEAVATAPDDEPAIIPLSPLPSSDGAPNVTLELDAAALEQGFEAAQNSIADQTDDAAGQD